MKRILILLAAILLLLLLLLGAAWYFFKGQIQSEAPVTSADLVPPSVAAFLWLPHVPKTIESFKTTPVYKMWQEQAVQAALEKLNLLNQPGLPAPLPEEGRKAWELVGPLWNTFHGEAFLAITLLSAEPSPRFEGIAGFQTAPDPAVFKTWTDQLQAAYPDLKWQEKKHPGQVYYFTENGTGENKQTVCVAQWKDWIFISLGESALVEMLNRIHAEKKDPPASLSGSASFQKLLSQQPAGFDTLAYINPVPILDMARQTLEKNNPQQIATLDAYKGLEAVMLTTSIAGENFRDRWIIQMPKAQRPDYGAAEQPLKGTTARLTTADTLLYSAQNIDLPALLRLTRATNPEEAKKIDERIKTANQFLAALQLDLEKDVLPKIGPEMGMILDWPSGKAYPNFSFALEHQDQAMIGKLTAAAVEFGGAMGGGYVRIDNKEIEGGTAYLFTIMNNPVIPAIWAGKDMLLITLNGPGLESTAKQTGRGLLDTAPYQALAAPSNIKQPISLLYADAEKLVISGHGGLSNLLPMAATLAGKPELAQGLPPVESLQPYLGRWLLLGGADDSGFQVDGLYEKGHPLIYGVVGAALVSDLAKAVAPMAVTMSTGAASGTTQLGASGKESVDPSLVLQDLVDLDDAISTWAKDENKPEGTPVAWNDIVPYLGENSQVATRVGLDPLGNAYVLGRTGPGQVTLSPATLQHFSGSVSETFWGKFKPEAAAAAQAKGK